MKPDAGVPKCIASRVALANEASALRPASWLLVKHLQPSHLRIPFPQSRHHCLRLRPLHYTCQKLSLRLMQTRLQRKFCFLSFSSLRSLFWRTHMRLLDQSNRHAYAQWPHRYQSGGGPHCSKPGDGYVATARHRAVIKRGYCRNVTFARTVLLFSETVAGEMEQPNQCVSLLCSDQKTPTRALIHMRFHLLRCRERYPLGLQSVNVFFAFSPFPLLPLANTMLTGRLNPRAAACGR